MVLNKLLSVFGPLPDALVKHVNNKVLEEMWESLAKDESACKGYETFEQWSEENFLTLTTRQRGLY